MDNEDQKLLELAAKACGIEIRWVEQRQQFMYQPYKYIDNDWDVWNPLKDDGDALRLAVKLRIDLDMYKDSIQCKRSSCFDDFDDFDWVGEDFELDELAATRRAIVRAAAEIGEKNGD